MRFDQENHLKVPLQKTTVSLYFFILSSNLLFCMNGGQRFIYA